MHWQRFQKMQLPCKLYSLLYLLLMRKIKISTLENLSKLLSRFSHILIRKRKMRPYRKNVPKNIRHGQIGRPLPIGHTKLLRRWGRPIFRAHTFCLIKKPIRSTNFKSNRWNNEKVTVNFKYYPEHQHICNMLMFT